MGIKISYTDTNTGNVLRETILDNEEVEAFNYVAADVIDWIDNCFQNRARQAIDEICERALGTDRGVILTDTDKTSLAPQIGIVAKVKQISIPLKKEIVRKATFDSAKERTNKTIIEANKKHF
jgi:hypothetical protein|tara:strand:+ start:212 stop:580 length:369 start_codon:yes stop_codon:yes gene_type:complete